MVSSSSAAERRVGEGGRRLFSLPVLAAISLISFVYYTTIFVFLDDAFTPDLAVVNLAVFTFFAFLCLLSFFTAVVTDPGRVPESFSPELEDPSLKNGAHLKYCERCSSHKPNRTHHCRVCKRCVLKMDHHCLWINNCVGYHNYKPFFVFVAYASVSSFYSMVIFVRNIFHTDPHYDSSRKLFYVFCGSIYFLLSFVLGTLLGWHMYLISRNLTTIEHRGEARARWLAKRSGQKYRHPYNIGVRRNVTSVLGSNVLKWFWPLSQSHLNDGCQFHVYHE